jgi:hypothetical protein
MSDIFISYSREDRETAQALALVLEQRGWSVWWDRNIPPGKSFDLVIEEALDEASCVIVLWSESSVTSDWVKTEADEGLRRGILVPALIANVKIPLAFRRIQAADLIDWGGEATSPGIVELLGSIAEILGDGEVEEEIHTAPQQQLEMADAITSVPSQEQPGWRTELISKEGYGRKIRVFLTGEVHVVDVKFPLTKTHTVELDGEVVAQSDETPLLGGEWVFDFQITDGEERYAAAVEVSTHWWHDKITKCRLIVANQLLYSEADS